MLGFFAGRTTVIPVRKGTILERVIYVQTHVDAVVSLIVPSSCGFAVMTVTVCLRVKCVSIDINKQTENQFVRHWSNVPSVIRLLDAEDKESEDNVTKGGYDLLMLTV